MPGELYTDGGLLGPNPSPLGGTWAWVRDSATATESGVLLPADIHCPTVTNNHAELFALCRGILSLPPFWVGTLYADSRMAVGWFFWAFDNANVPVVLCRMMQAARRHIDEQGICVTPSLLAGHPTKADLARGFKEKDGVRGLPVSVWNRMADDLCNQRKRLHLMQKSEVL